MMLTIMMIIDLILLTLAAAQTKKLKNWSSANANGLPHLGTLQNVPDRH